MELNTIISFVIEFIITFISIPGNILIIVVYSRKKRTSYSVLAIGLGITDLLISFTSPLRFYNYVHFGKHTSSAFCKAVGGTFYHGLNSSIFMAAPISFNRYIAVCKPYNYRLSSRASALSVAVCSGLSILAAVPPGLMFSLVSYPNDYFDCSIPPRHHLIATYYVFILAAIHFLTIIVTLTMYAFVLRRVRELGKVASVNGSTASATRSLKQRGEIEMNESVLHDGQPRPTEGKEDLPNIPYSPVADTTFIAVHRYPSSSRPTSNATVMSIVHVPALDNCQQAGPSTSGGMPKGRSYQKAAWSNRKAGGAVIAHSPRSTSEVEARKTSHPGDPPGRNEHSLTGEATRRHLIIILLYLTMWLPNLVVLICGYKPELRDTNYATYTVLMVVCRFPAINRIYHFVISFISRKSFRRDCLKLLIDMKNTLFRNS